MAHNATSNRQYRCVYCLEPCESLYYRYGGPTYSTSLSSSASSRTTHESSTSSSSSNTKTESEKESSSASLSSTSSVFKLNRCIICKNIVDPYCEREWLLILFDLILLRTEAYRHILCNDDTTTGSRWYKPLIRVAAIEQNQQHLKQKQQQQQRCNDSPFSSFINIIYQYQALVVDIMICCIARVYIQFQSTDGFAQSLHDLINSESLYDLQYAHSVVFSVTKSFIINLIISTVGQCTFIYMILFLVRIIHHTGDKKKDHKKTEPIDQYSQSFQYGMIVKSILWPTVASHLATILVGVWENSPTTRILGCTALPVIYQCMSLYHTLEATTGSTSTTIGHRLEPYNDTRQAKFVLLIAIKTTSLIVTAMIARSVVIMLITIYGNIVNPVCPGLQVVIDIYKLNATICLA